MVRAHSRAPQRIEKRKGTGARQGQTSTGARQGQTSTGAQLGQTSTGAQPCAPTNKTRNNNIHVRAHRRAPQRNAKRYDTGPRRNERGRAHGETKGDGRTAVRPYKRNTGRTAGRTYVFHPECTRRCSAASPWHPCSQCTLGAPRSPTAAGSRSSRWISPRSLIVPRRWRPRRQRHSPCNYSAPPNFANSLVAVHPSRGWFILDLRNRADCRRKSL